MASQAVSSIIGGVGTVAGAVGNLQDARWRQAAQIDALNFGRAGVGRFEDAYWGVYNPLRDNSLEYLDRMRPGSWESIDPYNNAVNGLLNPDELYSQYGGIPPELAALYDQYGGYQDQFGGQSDLFNSIAQGGGWSEAGGRIQDFGDLFMGGNTDSQNSLRDFGTQTLGRRGQTTNNQNMSDRANEVISYGGRTGRLKDAGDYADALFQTGGQMDEFGAIGNASNGLLFNGGRTSGINSLGGSSRFLEGGTPGLTQTGGRGMNVALGGLESGGADQYSTALQQRGLEMFGQDPLMSRDEFTTAARERAAGAARNNYDKARRDFRNVLGPGGFATTANAGDAYAGFADQAAQLEAQSALDAQEKYQGLALQQQGIGLGAVGQGAQSQTSRLGTYGNIFTDLEGAANQRFATAGSQVSAAEQAALARIQAGIGSQQDMATLRSSRQFSSLDALLGTENSATQRAGTYGGMLTNAEQLQQGWTGQGRDSINSALDSQFRGADTSVRNLGQMNQRENNAGQLGLANRQAGLGALGQRTQGTLGGLQFGNDRFSTLFGARNTGATQAGSRFSTYNQAYNTGLDRLAGMGNMNLNQARGYLGSYATPNQGASTWNAVGGIAQGIGQIGSGINGAMGAFGGGKNAGGNF